jgi:hypothetical protein
MTFSLACWIVGCWPVLGFAPVAATDTIPRAPAVDIHGEPGTFHVLVVSPPSGLPPHADLRFEILPADDFELLGRLSGPVARDASGEPAPLIVTLGIPAHALAGRTAVAHVLYTAAGETLEAIPLTATVTQVHAAAADYGRQTHAAVPGQQVSVPYTVTNTGNGPDSITVRFVGPTGWRVHGDSVGHVLSPGMTVAGQVRISVPLNGGRGRFPVRLVAVSAGGAQARAASGIEVMDPLNRAAGPGARWTAGAATVVADGRTMSPVLDLQVSGALNDQWRVQGRMAHATDGDGLDVHGLARVGAFLWEPYLDLTSPTAQVQLGSREFSFSELMGTNLWGRGARLAWEPGPYRAAAFAAQPTAGPDRGGHYVGASVGVDLGFASLSAMGTDLGDDLRTERRLSAIGLELTTAEVGGARASGAIAWRDHPGGGGLGWEAGLRQRSESGFLTIRHATSPGGPAAFARAGDRFSTAASRRFGRFNVDGSFHRSTDGSVSFDRLRLSSWSVAPAVLVGDRARLELRARSSDRVVVRDAARFGDVNTGLELRATTRGSRLRASGVIGAATIERTTGFGADPAPSITGQRHATRGELDWTTGRGRLGLGAGFARTDPGVGHLPREYMVRLRGDQLQLPLLGPRVLASGDIEHHGWFGELSDLLRIRAGLAVPLPTGFLLRLDAERHSLITGLSGGPRWAVGIRLERSLRLVPQALRGGTSGIVYLDREGAGWRDSADPPVGGVILRRGQETVVTDDRGRFRFAGDGSDPIRVDPASLPTGVLGPGPLPPPSGNGLEIGLIQTAAVQVRIVTMADEFGGLPQIAFADLVVRAHDGHGRVWSARADSTGLAVFHTLPPGDYELRLTPGAARGSIRVPDELPRFRLRPGEPVPELEIPILTRPLRIFRPAAAAPSGQTDPETREPPR